MFNLQRHFFLWPSLHFEAINMLKFFGTRNIKSNSTYFVNNQKIVRKKNSKNGNIYTTPINVEK